MNWLERYARKVGTAGEAVSRIRPGQRILVGSGAAEPESLMTALCDVSQSLDNNEVVHWLTLGAAPYVDARYAGRLRHVAFFVGKNVRQAVRDGRADFVPIFLSEVPRLIKDQRRVDVACIQVTPPDQQGRVSLGVSVDIVRAGVEAAGLVLAEVNPRMPWTEGDAVISVDEIDVLVPVDRPVLTLQEKPIDDACRKIGEHVAALVPDEATLQLGIGSLPDAVLRALENHRDLGIHTEMLSDGVMRLVEQGVVTGKKKTLNPCKVVTSFIMGSEALYEWCDQNPMIEMRGSEYTNDPNVIAQHDRMVSINAALEIDLTGQVQADSINGKHYSGIGGQVDFVRGASRSRGGRSIIAFPSTAKGGTISRIQAKFDEGAAVVTSRGDVHDVVTEFGVARLWGKSLQERAKALIDIAHPDFREELRRSIA